MAIKPIVTDLDGTLLDDDALLSERNSRAISELAERGVIVVPSSGRGKSEIPTEVLNHPGIKYLISSDGSVLENLVTGERITRMIPADKHGELLSVLRKYDAYINIHCDGECLCETMADLDAAFKYYRVSDSFIHHFHIYAVYTDDIDSCFDGTHQLEMLIPFFHSASEREECYRELTALGHSVAASDDVNLEIYSPEAGKGKMVFTLCEALGLSVDEIITVGDSRNDISMVAITPNSYAMENACDELKAVAKNIAVGNNEHVMEFFLKRLFPDS